MKMRFQRKKLLGQINEVLDALKPLGLNGGVVTHTVPNREGLLVKEIRSIGNGAYVVRTWSTDTRGNRVFTDLEFTVSKDSFTSSEGYSADVMEDLASLLTSAKLGAERRSHTT